MDETMRKAAADLEWARVLDRVAGYAPGELAAEHVRRLEPAPTREEAERRARHLGWALDALEQGEPILGLGVSDVEAELTHVEKGGSLSATEMFAVLQLLRAADALARYVATVRPLVPALAELLAVDPALKEPREALERSLDDGGRVSDGASSELRRARRQVGEARRALQHELSRQTQRLGDALRDQQWVERDGRYGLPVRTDTHRKVDGIVLGSSATGATVYVEPPAITAKSNRLRMAEADVEREEARVLAELGALLARHVDSLTAALATCLRADVLATLSRFAQRHRARVVPCSDDPMVEVFQMRHPLLGGDEDGDEVVPNDLRLAAGQALVVSGPNAGGKTVALKCLGLAVWMARAGLPLPVAHGSKVGWFEQVLTDIGDEQSIERSLSTFSAEVQNLVRCLERADGSTMVLLDEVAGGTDPEEGAALAIAVLEGLVERGAAVAVTTHYERLKEQAVDDARFVNASVGFDFEGMRPTFTLTMGVPGASSALAVASRFGLPEAIIDRAKHRISLEARRREELLQNLEREKVAAEEARRAAERDAEAARARLEEIEEERAAVRERERQRLAREKSQLVAKVKQARAKIDAVATSAAEGKVSARAAQKELDEAAHLVAVGGPLEEATRTQRPQGAPTLKVGARVWVDSLRAEGVIEAIEGSQARVRAGAFAVKVDLADLAGAEGGKRSKAPKAQPAKRPKRGPSPTLPDRAIRTQDNTCDLRGMRVEEALEELDRFVDHCVGGAHSIGFVLHGHGTGALKRAVREHLALSGHVATTRAAGNDEGGDAFTVFAVR